MYYFYFLQSINKSNEIYTGSTNNLRLRLSEHNKGKVFSTKRYLPWRLIYDEAYLSEKDARLREQKYKRHGKGNQELKKRLANGLNIFKKGESKDSSLTLLGKKGESKDSSLTLLGKNGESKGLPLTIFSKNGEGFTIPELLVSIAVMAVLSTIALADFHRGQYGNDLQASAEIMIGNIRRMQNMATAGVTQLYGGDTRVPPGGYGISFPWIPGTFCVQGRDATSCTNTSNSVFGYTMFTDFESWDNTNGCIPDLPNHLFDAPPRTDNGGPSCDKKVESGSVAFSNDVILAQIVLSKWTSPPGFDFFTPIDIVFQPPQPIPLIWGVPGKVQIELDHLQTKKCRTITIDAISGQMGERLGPISGSLCQLELQAAS